MDVECSLPNVSRVPLNHASCFVTELANVHNIVLILEYCSLVVVDVQIVRRGKDCHHRWEPGSSGLTIHSISLVLGFVSSNDGQEIVPVKELTSRSIAEKVRASANMIMNKELVALLHPKFFKRITPEQIAHDAMSGWFSKPINLRYMSQSI